MSTLHDIMPKTLNDLTITQVFAFKELQYLLAKNQDIPELYKALTDVLVENNSKAVDKAAMTAEIESLPVVLDDRRFTKFRGNQATKEAEYIASQYAGGKGKTKKPLLSLLGIIFYLDRLHTTYKNGITIETDKPFDFVHGGVLYTLGDKTISMAMGVQPITAGELVVYQELRRSLADQVDRNEHFTDVDYDYSLTVRTVSILCRKFGEPIPLSVIEREKWIEERSDIFKTLRGGLALDLNFFFVKLLLQFWSTSVFPQFLQATNHNRQ